ncbi:MAG: hypothetical protein GXO66_00835 [Euryarchaeota archaeon]|nr:hypothetical protein [Euryarchaeota archaeon]
MYKHENLNIRDMVTVLGVNITMMEQDFQYFLKSLIKAAENMEPHYFQLPVAGGDEPEYRERVYCYELYHQLRCILGNDFQSKYKLNGEVDKKGHPIIRKAKKPDFIVHAPGDMNNLVVIEVKSIKVEKRINELRKDLETLEYFLNEAEYYRGVMLIYGSVNGELPENIKRKIANIDDPRIMVLWHSEPNNIKIYHRHLRRI